MKTLRINKLFVAVAVLLCAATVAVGQRVGPLLNIERDGTNVLLNFAGRLQVADHANGPYADLADAISPEPYAANNPSRFWRTRFAREGTISGGSDFSAAIKRDGTLWTWGGNGFNQLGIQNPEWAVPNRFGNAFTAVSCGPLNSVAIRTDGTLWQWGSQNPTPVRVGPDSDWVAASCGGYHSMALKADGSLWGWGINYKGQLGIGNNTSTSDPVQVGTDTNWMTVAAGFYFTLAIKTDGSLWAWGNNSEESPLDGRFVNTNTPARIGQDNDWRAVSCGLKPQVVAGVKGFALAIKTNGTLWGMGYNNWGQLGTGTLANTNRPTQATTDRDWVAVACGHDFSVGLKTDGTCWRWGYGSGVGVTNVPVQMNPDTDWTGVACGGFHILALKRDGSLWAWGANQAGQLGNGSSISTRVPRQIGMQNEWEE